MGGALHLEVFGGVYHDGIGEREKEGAESGGSI